ncbi:MAG: Cof-type HAD-IIB family hydrolase [Christensenellaceae bacterium]|nr:Cof-type HAD-IIB family hydrolase [Christensenellaceae bacterium]
MPVPKPVEKAEIAFAAGFCYNENVENFYFREKTIMIKMIITDLDNTLLRRDKTISDYTIDIFRRVRECGMLIAFATARSMESSQEYRTLLNPDGDIITGGCLVFVGRQLLRSCYLPEPRGAALLAELCAYPSVKRVSARSLNASYSNIPTEGRICVDFNAHLPERLLHCSCRTDDGALMKSIAAQYPDFSFLHISGSDLYDINPKEATKLNGIKTISEYFNVHLSEVAAFGDDFNDVEMLRECGTGIAMSNAISECKAVANYVCGDCDEDGVAKWLEERVL